MRKKGWSPQNPKNADLEAARPCSPGFTLIEAIIALALFALLSAGTIQVWRYMSQNTYRLLDGADAFENARAAMDALMINIQLADELKLETDGGGTLVRLELRQPDTNGRPVIYVFSYHADTRRLEFGGNNEFASRVAEVKLVRDINGETMKIKIKSDNDMALESVLDIRHKIFT